MKIIIFKNSEGGLSTITPAVSIEASLKKIPEGVEYSVVDKSDIPVYGVLDDAREYSNGNAIVNIGKAKTIAHGKRKEARESELNPLDSEWTYQPEVAEPKRVVVREKYAAMQTDIDNSDTIPGIMEAGNGIF